MYYYTVFMSENCAVIGKVYFKPNNVFLFLLLCLVLIIVITQELYKLIVQTALTQLMTWRKRCGSLPGSPCSRETYESTANSLNFLSSSTLSNPGPLKRHYNYILINISVELLN